MFVEGDVDALLLDVQSGFIYCPEALICVVSLHVLDLFVVAALFLCLQFPVRRVDVFGLCVFPAF
jgi:hypothetical protein